MASTKFEVSMEIFKFQGEPDVSVTLTGKSPAELNTALKTLETIAKTTTLYDGDSAPEAEKNVTSEPKQAAPVVSTADKKAPPEKPVSWLPPLPRRKGLMYLRCPKCKKASYGRTNVEDAEIASEKFSCVCGRSIPKLTWNPAKRCYTT